MEINEIRRERLKALIAEKFGGVAGQMADAIGRPRPNVSGLLSGSRAIGERLARDIESRLTLPRGWLDQEGGNTAPAPSIGGTVPLISWVQAGAWSEVIDNLHPGDGEKIATTYRPRRHTYALRVHGDSMEPRFPDGCILIVEPDEQPDPGRFVVVRQNSDTEATFKQLVKDGGTLYLKPLNPRYPIMPLSADAVFCGVVKKMEMDV